MRRRHPARRRLQLVESHGRIVGCFVSSAPTALGFRETERGGGAELGRRRSATQALVTQRLAVPAPFTDSAPPITDVAKVKGDKVLYIPISLQIGVFQSTLVSMQQAAGHAGITVSGCDGKFGPAGRRLRQPGAGGACQRRRA